MVKERCYALDLLKCIAIFMVCAYHFPNMGTRTEATVLIEAMDSICVPMFFLVNGALLFDKPLDVMAHLKKCLTILLQFFTWKLISLLVLAGIRHINLVEVGWIHIVNVVFFFGNITDIDMAHLWFIPVLLSLYLLFPFFKSIFDQLASREHRIFYLCFVGVLLLVSMICNDGNVFKVFLPYVKVLNIAALGNFSPFQGLIASMLAYFLLGGLLQLWMHRLQTIKTGYLVLLYALGLGSLFGQHAIVTILVGAPEYDVTFTGYNTAATALMVCSLFLLAHKIPDRIYQSMRGVLTLVGKNTLGIYYIHWLLGTAFSLYCAGHFASHYGICFNMLRGLLLVGLSVLIAHGIQQIPGLRRLL